MKKLIVFALCLLHFACTPKKTETESSAVDTTAMEEDARATDLAAATLAYEALDGFMANEQFKVADSVNYFLIASEDQLTEIFGLAPGTQTPDFIINYIIGVVRQPNTQMANIALDSVRASNSSINVYLNVRQGAVIKTPVKASQLFAIERREGYPVMQFYINGKKDKALVLVP